LVVSVLGEDAVALSWQGQGEQLLFLKNNWGVGEVNSAENYVETVAGPDVSIHHVHIGLVLCSSLRTQKYWNQTLRVDVDLYALGACRIVAWESGFYALYPSGC
jgi:hypothetical protein